MEKTDNIINIFNGYSRYISDEIPKGNFLVSYDSEDIIVLYKDYFESYIEAINRLRKSIAKNSDPDDDLLVYPLLFLSRHLIELGLKWILYMKDNKNARKIHKTHSINSLNNRLNKDFNFSLNSKIKNLIAFINNIDQDSFSFRYPEDLKSNQCIHLKTQIFWRMENFYNDLEEFQNLARKEYYIWQKL